MEKRDPIRPLLGAATCFIIYWVVWNLLVSIARLIGGELVADTIPLLIAAAVAGWFGMMIFESRGLAEAGLLWSKGAGRNLGTGIALGAGGALLMILPLLPAGMAHFERIPAADASWGGALFTPLLLFCGAAGEEIIFRGFLLQYLMRGYGAWASILGVGTLFGLMHATNPGATGLGIANTAGFGILFGAALLKSHDLWLPIGMHFGWNVTLPFLGVGLSGLTIRVTEYRLVWNTGDLWSGGKYGPEASIMASAVLVVLSLVLWKIPVQRGWTWLIDGAPDGAATASSS